MNALVINKEFHTNTYQFREDGYLNLTHAAKVFNKDLSNFMRAKGTREYMHAFSNAHNIKEECLIEVIQGNRYIKGRGTWAHPKLAAFFARWLDVKFAVFCDMVIDDILNKKAELTITKPAESAAAQLPQDYLSSLKAVVSSLEEKKALEQELTHMTVMV